MQDILEAYDLSVDNLIEAYQKLNEPIVFQDGMVTSLGIVYWGKEEHMPALRNAIPCLKAEGIHRFRALREAIRTPGRMKLLSQQTGISPDVLRILKHDLELWFPKPVPLSEMELIQNYSIHLDTLVRAGIENQLQLIARAQLPQSRKLLSKQMDIPLEMLEEIVKCCDIYRMGSNLKHIRTRIYYEMGLDTWQKWACSTSEEIIESFTEHIQLNGLETVRLVPWPKEVRNGIEWAKHHLSIFAVKW
jgi:hypothetical protein